MDKTSKWNNDQPDDMVNCTSCEFCEQGPGEYCITKSGYIAQYCHAERIKDYEYKETFALTRMPQYTHVKEAHARIVTIEVVMPVDTVDYDSNIEEALRELHMVGHAGTVSNILTSDTMQEACGKLTVRISRCEDGSLDN